MSRTQSSEEWLALARQGLVPTSTQRRRLLQFASTLSSAPPPSDSPPPAYAGGVAPAGRSGIPRALRASSSATIAVGSGLALAGAIVGYVVGVLTAAPSEPAVARARFSEPSALGVPTAPAPDAPFESARADQPTPPDADGSGRAGAPSTPSSAGVNELPLPRDRPLLAAGRPEPHRTSSRALGQRRAPPPSLQGELALLERVEWELRQGNGAVALDVIAELEHRHPKAQLATEWDAVRVMARCQTGHPSARADAERLARDRRASTYAARIADMCRLGPHWTAAAEAPPAPSPSGTRGKSRATSGLDGAAASVEQTRRSEE